MNKLSITLFSLLMTCAAAFGQNIDIEVRNKPLKAVIEQLQKHTGYEFVINDKVLDLSKKVSVSAKNATLESVFATILSGDNVSWQIVDNKVVFSAKPKTGAKTPAKISPVSISGRVIDDSGEAIIGAGVIEAGTKNGTISDIDGSFQITLNNSESAVIEVSATGYETTSIPARANRNMVITLSEDHEMLNEAVVVGYGTMRKRDLTGSVSQVKVNESTTGTVSSISHALAGKAAGLQVTQTSAIPGAEVKFRIRGAASTTSNDPLVIIDGFPVESNSDSSYEIGYYSSGSTDNILGSLNPNDIESIEILKDASATAIYGSRAGHGVIIVTTKKGASGRARVSYSGSVSTQVMAGSYDMLSVSELMEEANRFGYESWMKNNKVGIYGGVDPESVRRQYTPYFTKSQIENPEYDTDWFGLLIRRGFQTQHNVSVTGGNDKTKYLISGNYFKQNGIIRTNDMERATGRINIEQKIGKYFTFGMNASFARNQSNNIPVGSGQNEYASLFVSASRFSPLLPEYDENGNYTLNPYLSYIPNPVSLLDITNKTAKNRLLGTAYLEFRPVEGLVIKANAGLDYNTAKHKVYMPKTTLYGLRQNGQADISQLEKNDYLFELTANYTGTIGDDHKYNVLGGWSFQQFNMENLWLGNRDFLTDAFLYNNMGQGQYEKPIVGTGATINEMQSFFARVNYSFKDRYLLTATVRADAAGNFAPEHRWGFFPSVSIGWIFSDEPFFEPLKSFWSNGKLRLSYGQTGNSNIGRQVESLFARKNQWNVDYHKSFGGQEAMGLCLSTIGNPYITWETTTEVNLGLDLGFFNNRINLTTELFSRVISDLLNWRPTSSLQEVTSIADNIGKTQSKGIEITLNTVNVRKGDFNWSTDFTFSTYRDRWLERAENWVPSAYSIYDGPIRFHSGYLSDGLVQADESVLHMPGAIPGQVKIRDINGYIFDDDGNYVVDEHGIFQLTGEPDGQINEADMVIYGTTDPKFICGINNTFNWKGFDLNFYLYGNFGLLNWGSYKENWIGSLDAIIYAINYPVTAKEVWAHDNQDAIYPGYFARQSSYGIADYFLKTNMWFVRCRNITLGYTFFPRRNISKVRAYADVNNPFIIQPGYTGFDMETDDSAYAYPSMRSFSFGIDLTF